MSNLSAESDLPDLHSEVPAVKIDILNVGHRGVRRFLQVAEEPCLATINIGVSLSSDQRGVHMSRLIRALDGPSAYESVPSFSQHVSQNLQELIPDAPGVYLSVHAERAIRVNGGLKPVTEVVTFDTTSVRQVLEYGLKCRVCLGCPQAQAILAIEAPTGVPRNLIATHSQVCDLAAMVGFHDWPSLPLPCPAEFLAICERAASGPVRESHRRQSEADVVKAVHGNTRFAEDTMRELAEDLISTFGEGQYVEVSTVNHESIFEYPLYCHVMRKRGS